MTRPALEGVRVLDFTRYVSGPYATMLLADAGAEVIKVEPEGGEVTRQLPPYMETKNGPVSTYFLRFNRGKKSVTLDIKSDADRPALEALIRSADVLVENFRPGTLERAGLGWEELQKLNPRLTYASISGFGHVDSPNRDWLAFNLVAEAMAGVLSQLPTNNTRPRAAGLPFGDNVASLHSLNGILLSLIRRHTTGFGSRVDISMFDSMLSMNEWSIAVQSGTGNELELGAEAHPWFAPYGLFEARDGWLVICVATDAHWVKFCQFAGWDDFLLDPRLETSEGRGGHFAEVIKPRLDAWLSEQVAQEVARGLADVGVPAAPLQRPAELLEDEQAHARNMLFDVPVTETESIRLAGNPVRIDPTPVATPLGFPATGEHNSEIFADLLPMTTDR